MKRLGLAGLALFAAALVASAPGPVSSALVLDEADNAFAREDYDLAEQLYGLAEPRAPDPGRVTLGLAASKYRRALASPTRAMALLAEAKDLYGYCLDSTDPRRATALVGLGNCLLREAGSHDADAALEAAKRYREAEHSAGGAALMEVSRYNLQLARLIARQIPTVPPDKSQRPPPSDDPQRDEKPLDSSSGPEQSADRDRHGKAVSRAAEEAGQTPIETYGSHSPGKGDLPPVPDRDGLPPLTPSKAQELLNQACRRIMDEGRQHRRATARATPTNVRDW